MSYTRLRLDHHSTETLNVERRATGSVRSVAANAVNRPRRVASRRYSELHSLNDKIVIGRSSHRDRPTALLPRKYRLDTLPDLNSAIGVEPYCLLAFIVV